MTTYPCNLGPFVCETGYFRGTGNIRIHGSRTNPAYPIGKKIYSGRLIVGLNVGSKPKWKTSDVVRLVRRIREEQVGDPSATFLSQQGIYKHIENGRVVFEKSVQVLIINPGSKGAEFTRQIIELAETLAEKLKQETVIAEVQLNGVTKGAWYVDPRGSRR